MPAGDLVQLHDEVPDRRQRADEDRRAQGAGESHCLAERQPQSAGVYRLLLREQHLVLDQRQGGRKT